ncbi:DNA helicase [Tanacetum coccineum]
MGHSGLVALSFFVTSRSCVGAGVLQFTCNIKGPEVTEYMDEFLHLTMDRADIMDRVFEMKIHQFVKYLQDAQPFGKIVAVLYTVEFQKRGLPHCHALIWIHEGARVRRDEDIDLYVSTELPSMETDPECYKIVSELMMHGPCGLACLSAPSLQNNAIKDRRSFHTWSSSLISKAQVLLKHMESILSVKGTVHLKSDENDASGVIVYSDTIASGWGKLANIIILQPSWKVPTVS